VHCIGTDADNIRPAQRALQMFKNPAFLALLMGTGPAAAAASPPSTACADIKDSTDTLAGAPAAAAADSLRCLMPALFRGGTLCWNPTVNKMTGLAINNLKVRLWNAWFFGGLFVCLVLQQLDSPVYFSLFFA